MDGSLRFPSRTTLAVVLAVCVLSGGYVVVNGIPTPFADEPTTVDVQNQDNTTYNVTVYQSSADSVSDISFTYDADNRTRYLETGEAQTRTGYRNLSVFNAKRSTTATVPAGGRVSLTLDAFDDSGTYAVIVETTDDRSVWTVVRHCGAGGADFYLDIVDSAGTASSSCS